jgi:hypothetical protein
MEITERTTLTAMLFANSQCIQRFRQAEPSNGIDFAWSASRMVPPMEGPACQDRAWDERFPGTSFLIWSGI